MKCINLSLLLLLFSNLTISQTALKTFSKIDIEATTSKPQNTDLVFNLTNSDVKITHDNIIVFEDKIVKVENKRYLNYENAKWFHTDYSRGEGMRMKTIFILTGKTIYEFDVYSDEVTIKGTIYYLTTKD